MIDFLAMTAPEYHDLRDSLGLTQAALAHSLGVTRMTINRREAADPEYPISTEAALAISCLAILAGKLAPNAAYANASLVIDPGFHPAVVT